MSKNEGVTRRKFLKLCGLTSIAAAIGIASSASDVNASPDTYSFMFDASRCVNCRKCVTACKRWNNLKGEVTETEPEELSAETWNVVNEVHKAGNTYFIKRQCMHCMEPACVFGCPTGALKKYPEGPVVVDTERCIGCRNCVVACPFGIPKFDEKVGVVRKCWMCYNRVKSGLPTACVESCPYNALFFGTRDEMLTKAKARKNEINGYIYGETEAGGTGVIYVSSAPLTDLHLPTLSDKSQPTLMVDMVKSVIEVGAVVASAAFALLYFKARRTKPVEKLKEV